MMFDKLIFSIQAKHIFFIRFFLHNFSYRNHTKINLLTAVLGLESMIFRCFQLHQYISCSLNYSDHKFRTVFLIDAVDH
jgi:hypothetical protein